MAAARGDGRVAAAVALARGLGIEAELDVPELVLRSLEDGQLDEANDIVGADGPAAAAVLRKMLDHSRCLPYALSFLPALRHVPPPDGAALARLGGEALALDGGGSGGGGGGDGAAAAATREAVRAEVEAALRSVWADARVHLFGSALLGVADGASDVDLAAVVPSLAHAHARDAAGRAALEPLLAQAAAALRGCGGGLRAVQVAAAARVPIVRAERPLPGAGSVKVDLCINNSDGLANSYVLAALCRRGGPPFVAALAAARRWARARRLSGQHCTPNTFGWSVLAAHAAQQVGVLPSVDASAAFADLAAASAPPEAWAALADASLGAVSVDGVASLLSPLAHAGVHSPAGGAAPPPRRRRRRRVRPTWRSAPAGCSTRSSATLRSTTRTGGASSALRALTLSKEEKGWTRRFDGALMIEDPLERDRDLGKLTSRAAVHAVRFDAATALLALSSPSPAALGALCTPFDWRLRERRRAAGAAAREHARRLAADAAAGALVAAPVAVRSAAAVAEMLAALRADGAVRAALLAQNVAGYAVGAAAEHGRRRVPSGAHRARRPGAAAGARAAARGRRAQGDPRLPRRLRRPRAGRRPPQPRLRCASDVRNAARARQRRRRREGRRPRPGAAGAERVARLARASLLGGRGAVGRRRRRGRRARRAAGRARGARRAAAAAPREALLEIELLAAIATQRAAARSRAPPAPPPPPRPRARAPAAAPAAAGAAARARRAARLAGRLRRLVVAALAPVLARRRPPDVSMPSATPPPPPPPRDAAATAAAAEQQQQAAAAAALRGARRFRRVRRHA